MILKNSLLPNAFDLSSLSRALEEIILPQAGRLAMAAFNVFDLSSLARTLDEDIASQSARFTTAISNAFDLSALSLALDEDIAAEAARPFVPATTVLDVLPLAQTLNNVGAKAPSRPAIPIPNLVDMSPLSLALNVSAEATQPANAVSNVFDLTVLSQALDEDIATQVQKMNAEQRVTARSAIITLAPVAVSAAPMNRTDPSATSVPRAEKSPVCDVPTEMNNRRVAPATKIGLPAISARRAGKLPVRDAPVKVSTVSAMMGDKVAAQVIPTGLPRIDTTSMASSSKVRVEDLNRRVGINVISKTLDRSRMLLTTCPRNSSTPSSSNAGAISVKGSTPLATTIVSGKRKFDRAFEIFEVPLAKRTVESLAHTRSRKRRLSDALVSSKLPAKKRQRNGHPESSVSPALSVVGCQPVISAPVNLLPINKRKRDDAVVSSKTVDPRKRRRADTSTSGDDVPLPTSLVISRKRKWEERIAPEVALTSVKQWADDGERILFESAPKPEEERSRVAIGLPARKRKRTANVFGENDAEESVPESLDALETSQGSASTTETEEPAVPNDKDADVVAGDDTEVESNATEDEDEAWQERFLELCRQVFGDGEVSDDEDEGPATTKTIT